MTSVVSAQALARNLVRVGVGAPLRMQAQAGQGDALLASGWSVQALSEGLAVRPVQVRASSGAVQFDLLLSGPMTPGELYRVTGPGVVDQSGDALAGAAAVTAPDEDLELTGVSGVLEALTGAFGEVLEDLGGAPATRLRGAFVPGHDVLLVETTLGLPPSGRVWVAGRALSFEGLCPSGAALLGVVDSAPDGQALDEGQAVWLDPMSVAPGADGGSGAWLGAAWRAWRATLVHSAVGEDLDGLSALYGVPRIRAFGEQPWRMAMLKVALGARGTLGTTFAWLEALYSERAHTYQVQIDPAQPSQLVASSGAPWGPEHIGRLVRLEYQGPGGQVSKVFWSSGPALEKGQSTNTLHLASVRTSYFEGARFDAGQTLADGAQTVQAVMLPFVMGERGPGELAGRRWQGRACLVEVWIQEQVARVPATYLIDPPGAARGATPPGGILLDDFNLAGDDPAPSGEGNQNTGPHPIYLPGDSSQGAVARRLDALLAAGVATLVKVRDFAAGGTW